VIHTEFSTYKVERSEGKLPYRQVATNGTAARTIESVAAGPLWMSKAEQDAAAALRTSLKHDDDGAGPHGSAYPGDVRSNRAAATQPAVASRCDTYMPAPEAFGPPPNSSKAVLTAFGLGAPPQLEDACRALCDALPPCAGITIVAGSGGGTCVLVDSAGASTAAGARPFPARSWHRVRATEAPAAFSWWVAPPTLHVFQDSMPTSARYCPPQKSMTLAGARGERENSQVVLWAAADKTVRIVLKNSAAVARIEWYTVGFVQRNASTIAPNADYPFVQPLYPSEKVLDRVWYPDVLLPPGNNSAVQLSAGLAQPVWFSADISKHASSGNSSSTVQILDDMTGQLLAEVNLTLEVWEMQPLDAELGSFVDVVGFDDHSLSLLYPATARSTSSSIALLANATTAFNKALCDHRMPPTMGITGSGWAAPTDEAMEAAFMEHFTMLVDPARCNQRLALLMMCGTSANATSSYVDTVIDKLAPRVEAAEKAGLLGKAFVYAFDESHDDHIPAIAALFGAIKERWPGLSTLSVLDWQTEADLAEIRSLPIDIWVVTYSILGLSSANSAIDMFRQSQPVNSSVRNREVWGYHCWGPHGLPCPHEDGRCQDSRLVNETAGNNGVYPNTFVDVPVIQSRLLRGFLPLVQNWTGWLYWYSNFAFANPGYAHTDARFIELNSLSHTAFDPTVQSEPGAYEDGNLIYPGVAGPVISQRLANWRDGAEDHALFARLTRIDAAAAFRISRKLVTNSTFAHASWETIEAARAEAARLISAWQVVSQ
jgi:hypothetical protein